MLAASWLYTFAPPVVGGVFFGLTGRVPLAIQVLNLVWLVLIVLFTPLLAELFTSYSKYAELWRRNNEQPRNG
jgi:hypothetical protein